MKDFEKWSAAMANKSKIDRAVKFLISGHLEFHGGYEHDYAFQDGVIHVAGLDDSKDRQKTEIASYLVSDLETWHDEAWGYITEVFNRRDRENAELWNPSDTITVPGIWWEAFNETRPQEWIGKDVFNGNL